MPLFFYINFLKCYNKKNELSSICLQLKKNADKSKKSAFEGTIGGAMKFDDNHEIHLERVDRNYSHMDILCRINEEAFPKEERLDLFAFFDWAEEKNGQLHAVVDGEVPVGFTIWFDFGENYIFWFYLAIDSQYQRRQYGTKTERLIFDVVLKDKIIFGGVEALDPSAENYEQRISRIKFHKKNGFHIFDKVFDFGKAGKYQLVCTDPSISVDMLADKFFSVVQQGTTNQN